MLPTVSLSDIEIRAMTVEQLEEVVRRHNHLYWDLQRPEISDYEYDRLVERLKQLRPDSPALLEMGPAKEDSIGQGVIHAAPMLSLDKCYSDEDLLTWAAKLEGKVMVTPKMDGIAASLRYDEAGRLNLAATRGSGVTGDDVTQNARTISDIPQQISKGEIEVRGEIYMRLGVFASFSDQFSNPRNLAAGAIKHKDPRRCRDYRLSFAAYDLLGTELATEGQKMEFLAAHGFSPVTHRLVDKAGLRQAYEHFVALRGDLDFEIDGVVFKANEVAEQKRLGSTAHHPRYALAYKFQGDSSTTTLLRVEWSVARSGVITPVARIEPVTLSGAEVSRASLHNAGFVKKLGLLDKPTGAKVLVTRRGGVIPKVEFVVEPASPATDDGRELVALPERCPSCSGPVRQERDFLYCQRPEACRDALISAIAHYCAVIEILGFGDKLLAQAYDHGLLHSPADLYTVTEEALIALERVGKKLAAKLIREVHDHRRLELATFLRALGIEELGQHVSQILAHTYGTLERVRRVTTEELADLHTIGPEIAARVVAGFKEKAELIDRLLVHVTLVSSATKAPTEKGPLTGQSFVFTGALLALERKTARQEVEALGGEVPSGVTKGLTYLVIGDGAEERRSTKRAKAEKYIDEGAPIRIIGEEEFLKLIGKR